MTVTIGRRELLAALRSAAAAWPIVARGQQPAMPVIGFLRSSSLADVKHLVMSFRQGLQEAGYVAGDNVAIEYRFAENRNERPARIGGRSGSSSGGRYCRDHDAGGACGPGARH